MVGLDNPLHIALVLIVVLMVFGAKRLPEMGKGLGEGMRGFKQAISGETPAQPTQISLAKVDEQPVAAAQTTTEQQTPVA
jgi:sec-independent protein translocase protein TatA